MAFGAALGAAAALITSYPAGAAAAGKPITGTLSRGGVGVVATSPDGRTATATIRGRTFRVVPLTRTARLHLRTSQGRYGGPVVIRAITPSRVVVGVREGAKL